MITRTLTNAGDPLVDGLGNPLAGVAITFTLVDSKGLPADGWDVLTGERIAPGPWRVMTDANGVFTVGIWPTSRGDSLLFWKCSVDLPGIEDFKNGITEGPTLSWIDFKFSGVAPTPGQLDLLAEHLADASLHLQWKGAFVFGTAYDPYDAVSYNGGSWKANRSNVNVYPAEGADWTVLAMRGAQGVPGVTTISGVTVLSILDLVTAGPWVDVRVYSVVGDGVTDVTAGVNSAIAAAIANGSRVVLFPGGQYNVGALTNYDQVVFVGLNAAFLPGISYKINQLGAIAGKQNTKYSVMGCVPRNDSITVTSITRVGTLATATVASTKGLSALNYVTISGAAQPEYNITAYPITIAPTTFTFSIAGSPATPATGTLLAHWWAFIDDAAHAPTGFASVTTPDVYTLRLNYDSNNGFSAKKISDFIVGADDALAPHGLIAGGDVGSTYANIKMSAPLCCSFSGGAANVPAMVDVPPLLTSALTVQNSGAGTRQINHPAVFAGDVPVVSVKSYAPGISQPKEIQVAYTTTTVKVNAVSPISGFVSWGGAAFGQSLSDNLVSPTFAWNGTTGVLTVTHEAATNDTLPPMITPHGGIYIPHTVDVSANTFSVSFYDYAGNKITGAANANMMFTYRKVVAKTLAEWPADMVVTVRRGPVPIRTDDVWRVAGNNLWVHALMESY